MEKPRGAEGRQAGRRIAGLTSKKWPTQAKQVHRQASMQHGSFSHPDCRGER